MDKEPREFTVTMPEGMWAQILNMLAEAPLKISGPIDGMVRTQIAQQIQPPPDLRAVEEN
jgi:hypothetical protein